MQTATCAACSRRATRSRRSASVEAAAEAGAIAAHATWRAGRSAEAEALLDRARTMLDGRDRPRALLAEALAESARLAAFGGRLVEAEGTSLRALELAKALDLEELEASALQHPRRHQHGPRGSSAVSRPLPRGRRRADELPEQVRALTNLAVI